MVTVWAPLATRQDARPISNNSGVSTETRIVTVHRGLIGASRQNIGESATYIWF
ncbi:hypothetical protein DPMN_051403 [Dreissena polymorpha]|uniref:Uncharacterized protein n=1 Tax=Dreissena polymorpha TaxID=45954 RepID=A0A9D4CJD7_DREPO|nr:hypothetical protein DPMN_051403 [Dreissena polymorpha]